MSADIRRSPPMSAGLREEEAAGRSIFFTKDLLLPFINLEPG
jgi:hypothetical protein